MTGYSENGLDSIDAKNPSRETRVTEIGNDKSACDQLCTSRA